MNSEKYTNPLHCKHISTGRVLLTHQTLRWDAKTFNSCQDEEAKKLFFNFSSEDEGRSRELVAQTENTAYAKRIELCWNICKEVDDRELRRLSSIDENTLKMMLEQTQKFANSLEDLEKELEELEIICDKYNWSGLAVFSAFCVGVIVGALFVAFK